MTPTPLRYRRYRLQDGSLVAARIDDGQPVAAASDLLRLDAGDHDPAALAALEAALRSGRASVVAPVDPSKLVCIGLNYRRHAEEMNKPLPSEPFFFIKPSTAVVADGDAIELPPSSSEVHYEGELALVIGRRATRVGVDEAMDCVLGWTLLNDVTARDIQRREPCYTRAKGFDSFAPLGPDVVTAGDPDAMVLETRVDGQVRQRSGCDDLIFKVPFLVSFVSQVMTLLPGDVISTGTPSGVGPLREGETVSVSVAELGMLSNPVRRRVSP